MHISIPRVYMVYSTQETFTTAGNNYFVYSHDNNNQNVEFSHSTIQKGEAGRAKRERGHD